MRETKSCPFCDSTIGTTITYYKGKYWVSCFKCNASTTRCSEKADAIIAWNLHPKIIKRTNGNNTFTLVGACNNGFNIL